VGGISCCPLIFHNLGEIFQISVVCAEAAEGDQESHADLQDRKTSWAWWRLWHSSCERRMFFRSPNLPLLSWLPSLWCKVMSRLSGGAVALPNRMLRKGVSSMSFLQKQHRFPSSRNHNNSRLLETSRIIRRVIGISFILSRLVARLGSNCSINYVRIIT
jgi:hypothetical protein